MKKTQARLAEAERNAAKGELTAILAHEINNPLTAILGHTQLILQAQAYPPASGFADELATVNAAAQRIARIVKEFRRFATLEGGGFEEADLCAAVRAGVSNFQAPQDSRGFAVTLVLPPIPQWVNANASLLAQVVMNLLLNSLCAMHRGVAIDIEVDGDSDAEVVCRIRDDGPGWKPPDLEHVFEPDSAAKPAADRPRSAGLRLYMPECIIHHYGGRVAVESTPGRGTTVTFALPRAAGSNADAE